MQKSFRHIAFSCMLLSVVVYIFMGFHHHHGERVCFVTHAASTVPVHEGCGRVPATGGQAALHHSRSCTHASHDTATSCRADRMSALPSARMQWQGVRLHSFPPLWGVTGETASLPSRVAICLFPSFHRTIIVHSLRGFLSVAGLRAPPSSSD